MAMYHSKRAKRNRFGQFIRRGRSRGRYRRRGNPSLLLAGNPSRRAHSGQLALPGTSSRTASLAHRVSHKAKRRKSSWAVASVYRGHPRNLRRRGSGRRLLAYHGKKYTIRRRSNPFGLSIGNAIHWARLGLFAGLGIVVARLVGGQYTLHIAPTVLGASGAADPKSLRAIANEVLRLIAMAAGSVLIGEAVVRRMSQTDANAFNVGAMAECGRQGIALVVSRVSPTTNLQNVGLGAAGSSGWVEMRVDGEGWVYGKNAQGQWFKVGRRNGAGMSGLVDSDTMNGLVDSDTLEGEDEREGTDEGEYDSNDY